MALYITNAPVPFVNKVRPASENVNPSAGGQLPDPNKPLQQPMRAPDTAAVPPPKLDAATDPKAAPPPPEKGVAAVCPTMVRAICCRPAHSRRQTMPTRCVRGWHCSDSTPKIFPREQDGVTLYRVRLGPYGNIEDVNRMRKTMAENGIDVQLIKVR